MTELEERLTEKLQRMTDAVRAVVEARADIFVGRTWREFLLDTELWEALKAELVDPPLGPIPPGCVICAGTRSAHSTCCDPCWRAACDLRDLDWSQRGTFGWPGWDALPAYLSKTCENSIVTCENGFADDQEAIDYVREKLSK